VALATTLCISGTKQSTRLRISHDWMSLHDRNVFSICRGQGTRIRVYVHWVPLTTDHRRSANACNFCCALLLLLCACCYSPCCAWPLSCHNCTAASTATPAAFVTAAAAAYCQLSIKAHNQCWLRPCNPCVDCHIVVPSSGGITTSC
jgi:hypothetical protein